MTSPNLSTVTINGNAYPLGMLDKKIGKCFDAGKIKVAKSLMGLAVAAAAPPILFAAVAYSIYQSFSALSNIFQGVAMQAHRNLTPGLQAAVVEETSDPMGILDKRIEKCFDSLSFRTVKGITGIAIGIAATSMPILAIAAIAYGLVQQGLGLKDGLEGALLQAHKQRLPKQDR